MSPEPPPEKPQPVPDTTENGPEASIESTSQHLDEHEDGDPLALEELDRLAGREPENPDPVPLEELDRLAGREPENPDPVPLEELDRLASREPESPDPVPLEELDRLAGREPESPDPLPLEELDSLAGRESANGDDDQLVVSYLILRRTIGILGVLLPVIVGVGAVLFGSTEGLRDSISAYYDTVMRNVFVGFLFAIGVFLFSYTGHEASADKRRFEPTDDVAGNLACAFALGVALFPVSGSGLVPTLHFVSAVGMFLTLAYFSLFLFTKTGGYPTKEKKARNKVYMACGAVILACISLIAVYEAVLEGTSIASIKPVFWLETLALWAFGFSWFVKGETLLKDTE